jgi:hypothetical protein
MTSATGFIDRTARNAGKLPLPRIVATMLGVATAFFCFAMPQDVLDALFGSLGLAGPIGPVGRTLFLLFFTALAAGLGWMVVTVAGSPAIKREIDLSADRTPTQPRRRSFNPSDPSRRLCWRYGAATAIPMRRRAARSSPITIWRRSARVFPRRTSKRPIISRRAPSSMSCRPPSPS